MKKNIRQAYVLLVFYLLLCFSLSAAVTRWEELKGEHFIIFYGEGQKDFAKKVFDASEDYYDRIASDLGYARYSNFWQWDKRVKIHIFPEKTSFIEATGQPAWSVGNARYDTKEINGFADNDIFLTVTLPHEIAHLIFRDFVGFKGEVPLWLDEGVAQWEEKPMHAAIKYFVKGLHKQGKLSSLRLLTRTDVRNFKDDKEVESFYVQAASVVGFLIENYGVELFTDFCRQLRDGKSLDESLKFTYPTQIRSVQELEAKWLKYILESKLR